MYKLEIPQPECPNREEVMPEIRKQQISQNLLAIHEEIRKALADSDLDIEPTLLCVSKNHPLSDILIASELGETEFGENKVQELLRKKAEFCQMSQEERAKYQIHWHFIGTLQRNKVKDIVGEVELIHSVHSTKLLKQISKVSVEKNVTSEILLQVNVAREESKHGFTQEELSDAIKLGLDLPKIKLRGLMTMAPFYDAEEVYKTEKIFEQLQCLLLGFQKVAGAQFNQLSMGMSNDFPYAVKAGSTILRIGTDIFGARQ